MGSWSLLLFFPPFFFDTWVASIQAQSRRDMLGKTVTKGKAEDEKEVVKKHSVCVFLFLNSSFCFKKIYFSCRKPLIIKYLLRDTCLECFFFFCECAISSPAFLPFLRCFFILLWLICFTSPAVISTAFTELINRAEGWVLLDRYDSFLLPFVFLHSPRTTDPRKEDLFFKY